ncbi:MAG TPA: chromosome segregation protein SMC, partial [Firmicutes bacterium]|nr:chromosome segregation protein SMC [Bacillota bacterium]
AVSKKDRKEIEFEHLSLNSKILNGERKVDALKQQHQVEEQSVEALQNELVEAAELIQMLQGKRDVLNERHKNAVTNKDEMAKQQEEFETNLESAKQEQEKASSEVTLLQETLTTKQETLAELNEEYQNLEANLRLELEETRQLHFEDLNELSSTKNQYISVNQQIKRIEATLERIKTDEEKLVQDMTEVQLEKETFMKGYDAHESKLIEKREEYQTLLKQHTIDKKQYEAEVHMANQSAHQLDKLKQRLQWLEDAQKDFSGFNEGVKKILKAREQQQIKGIEGAVAEIVSVPKELELAMDVVLGPVMQQIVTSNDDSAKQAIDFLKRNHAGRATFLPLNVMKSRLLSPDVLKVLKQERDVVGVASQLVAFEERYRNIAENILGNIIVAKDLNVAKNLAKKLNYRFRIVTLDGDVINAGGAMTGGAVKRQGSSLLRAKNEIE